MHLKLRSQGAAGATGVGVGSEMSLSPSGGKHPPSVGLGLWGCRVSLSRERSRNCPRDPHPWVLRLNKPCGVIRGELVVLLPDGGVVTGHN